MAGSDRRQYDGDLQTGQGGSARHDEAPMGPHHQHRFRGWRDRQSRANQLCCQQGRHDWLVQSDGAGNRQPQHHG